MIIRKIKEKKRKNVKKRKIIKIVFFCSIVTKNDLCLMLS